MDGILALDLWHVVIEVLRSTNNTATQGGLGTSRHCHGVAVGRYYRTVLHVDDFGDRTPACIEYTHLRADSDSRLFAAIRERTIIGPVPQVHIIKFLGKYGIEIQIPSTTSPMQTSWEVVCRGQTRFVEELRHLEPEPNPTSKE